MRQMLADTSSLVCSAAKADSLVRGAANPWLLRLLGIGGGIGVALGWLDNRSDIDTDTDDQAMSVSGPALLEGYEVSGFWVVTLRRAERRGILPEEP